VYLDYFGLNEAPFRITPNTDYWYRRRQARGNARRPALRHRPGRRHRQGHRRSRQRQDHAVPQAAAQLPDSVDSVYLGNPTLSPDEMLAAILADLASTRPKAAAGWLAQLCRHLLARHAEANAWWCSSRNRRACRSRPWRKSAAADQPRNRQSDKLLQIVLFGQPELECWPTRPCSPPMPSRRTTSSHGHLEAAAGDAELYPPRRCRARRQRLSSRWIWLSSRPDRGAGPAGVCRMDVAGTPGARPPTPRLPRTIIASAEAGGAVNSNSRPMSPRLARQTARLAGRSRPRHPRHSACMPLKKPSLAAVLLEGTDMRARIPQPLRVLIRHEQWTPGLDDPGGRIYQSRRSPCRPLPHMTGHDSAFTVFAHGRQNAHRSPSPEWIMMNAVETASL
jgi:hypothetical protein